jgi:hypothetical protein
MAWVSVIACMLKIFRGNRIWCSPLGVPLFLCMGVSGTDMMDANSQDCQNQGSIFGKKSWKRTGNEIFAISNNCLIKGGAFW